MTMLDCHFILTFPLSCFMYKCHRFAELVTASRLRRSSTSLGVVVARPSRSLSGHFLS